MKMANNTFTRALANGDKQVGLWVTFSSAFVAEVTAPAGYDWVLIDMEHSPNDYMTVLGQLQAFAATSTTAIVRPEWNDAVVVKRGRTVGKSTGAVGSPKLLANLLPQAVAEDFTEQVEATE